LHSKWRSEFTHEWNCVKQNRLLETEVWSLLKYTYSFEFQFLFPCVPTRSSYFCTDYHSHILFLNGQKFAWFCPIVILKGLIIQSCRPSLWNISKADAGFILCHRFLKLSYISCWRKQLPYVGYWASQIVLLKLCSISSCRNCLVAMYWSAASIIILHWIFC
jgi:hypothetical protein